MSDEQECTCGLEKCKKIAERLLIFLKKQDIGEQNAIKSLMLALYVLCPNADEIASCANQLEDLILSDEFNEGEKDE